MSATVVITTYDRASLVAAAIASVFNQPEFGAGDEVVVVDDASRDDTKCRIEEKFATELARGQLRYVRNEINLGVTGSKNVGFYQARNRWVVFLDSDDTLLPGVWPAMSDAFHRYKGSPIIFFRCIDQDDNFVGTRFEEDRLLDLCTYLQHTSFGEALTAVNKELVDSAPYIESLRGYEGLGCCRMIASKGPAILSSVIARRYMRVGSDRISAASGLVKRMPLLAKGHILLLREFGREMRLIKQIGYVLKAFFYAIIGYSYRVYAKVSG